MSENSKHDKPSTASRLRGNSLCAAREMAIVLAFCLFTALMTWPWILHLRDAVADRGDPYMIAWTLWWDYHQTFHNPLHLFDANIFYPYQYTLAFSENDYGIALLFFPLFAAGVKPLTVQSIATFLGFAFCGYGAFRLTRTLTGRKGPAWIAGIVFAFVPFRFHVLSHLHYLFAGWIPLMLEALVLFARGSTWRRAAWLGIAFFMNGLTCISWLIMTIVPLALTVIFLVWLRKSARWDRAFWLRGSLAVALASLALFPFLWPYYRVQTLYGFRWEWWEFAFNSSSVVNWLKCEPRNRVWQDFGARISGPMLFPGLLAPLLALVSLQFVSPNNSSRWITRFVPKLIDLVIIASGLIALLAVGYGDRIYRIPGIRIIRLNDRSIRPAVVVLLIAVVLRLGLILLRHWRRELANGEFKLTEAIGIGAIWTVSGFLSSLGANFFFNRWLHDYFLLYQSIRIPSRAAMLCYLGLALLAGIGAWRVAEGLQKSISFRQVKTAAFALIALAFLFELRASPLKIESGEVYPSSLALRLKLTPMRGGLVELPSRETDVDRHLYMLRAADHARPLVNATSSFISPITNQINKTTSETIEPNFMDLLEKIPASYLVIHNDRLPTGWPSEYEIFLIRSLRSGRLRFINRFDGHDDLYAVVRSEPDAVSEAVAPFPLIAPEWSAMIEKDQSNSLAPAGRGQSLYRIYLGTTGTLPRYAEFMADLKTLARGVYREADDEEQTFNNNLREFVDKWVGREAFITAFGNLDDAQYVERLAANTGIALPAQERAALVDALKTKRESRAAILLKVAVDRRFVDKENDRSLVLMHYFAYLHRNPGEPPDRDLSGFNFWIRDMAKEHNPAKLSFAFRSSIEYQLRQKNR